MKKVEYHNITYIIGENAQDNWDILNMYKKENNKFIWFHLNSFPSCYVIMCSTINNLDKSQIHNYLHYGAELCKNNTKYKNLKNVKIIYTTLNKLSNTDTIGEVIISGKTNIVTV
jgi:hypothetical protein